MVWQTQTETYWQQLSISEEDIDRIYNYLIDATEPVPLERLARVLVESRMREEERQRRELLSKGKVYRPKDDYDIGDVLVFPALDYAVGTVVGKRSGRNPAYPDFQVIRVRFEETGETREFAAAFKAPHPLNENGGTAGATRFQSPEEVLAAFGEHIQALLQKELEARDEFVYIGGGWFLRDSLAEIHVGHLNIADAVIDLAGRPVTLDEILAQLDLPQEIPPAIQRLSLEQALVENEQFVSVDVNGERRWFLRRLLPRPLAQLPRLLRFDPVPYRRDDLPISLLQLEWELDDEWTETTESAAEVALSSSATLVLIYPHRYYGTLPITSRVQPLLPQFDAELAQVTFIDGRWGDRFTVWVAPAYRFIAGLEEWYEKHKIPAGAYVTLERKVDEPGTYVVDYRPRRMKREWARIAHVADDRVTFEMGKIEVACEVDEHLLVAADDPEALEQYAESLPDPLPPVRETVAALFPELAKLHPQGRVHAKTLYAAVNMVRRCPPGPIFAVLATDDRYGDVGDGYWIWQDLGALAE